MTLLAAEVDAVWEQVKALTERGELGYKSKVSTQGLASRDERVLCARTYDAGDRADVERVGAALRALGLERAGVRGGQAGARVSPHKASDPARGDSVSRPKQIRIYKQCGRPDR